MHKKYLSLPRTVYLLCLGTLVNRAGSFVLIYLTIYLGTEMELGTRFATRCIGLFGLGSLLSSIVGGQFADAVGRKAVMLVSLLVGAATLILVGELRSAWAIAGAILLFAFFSEMYRPAVSAMIGDVVAPESRTHAFSLMYICINLGFAIGAWIASEIVRFSFAWLFYGDAATMALFGVIVLVWVPETRRPRTPTARPGTSTNEDATVPFLEAFRRILADRDFVLFSIATTLISLVFVQGFGTLPIYMTEAGLSPDVYGKLMVINGAMIFLLQLPLTSLLAHRNRMVVILIGAVFIGTGYFLTGLAGSVAFFALTVMLWTFGEMLEAPFKAAVITDIAPVELRARYLGIFNMCFSLAFMLGAPIGGEVLALYGADTLWAGTGVVAAVVVGMYLVVLKPINTRASATSQGTPADVD